MTMGSLNNGSPDGRTLKLGGHVGFDSLPDQLVNKSVQNGFSFNILCIGETGIGKSTLCDSLFNTTFDSAPESGFTTCATSAHFFQTLDAEKENRPA